jgi:hypothetical protein
MFVTKIFAYSHLKLKQLVRVPKEENSENLFKKILATICLFIVI